MKENILELLRKTDDYISGQQLCSMFNVSRTAVWKVICQLKSEGYVIEAVKNRGYRLIESPELVTDKEIKHLLETDWAARHVVYKEEVGSTNRMARSLAEDGAVHGTLVIAEAQTMGRGRLGRMWHSPNGSGIWMSIILRPDIMPTKASMLTIVAALAVYDAIAARVEGCAIKWPNDIVIDGRKVCGILTEMSAELEAIHHVVIGIGINVNTENFPDEVASVATSMRMAGGDIYNRSEIVADIWKSFEKYYEAFIEAGDLSKLIDIYNERLINRDREVVIEKVHRINHDTSTAEIRYNGVALGIDRQGQLLVRHHDGELESVVSGEVSVRGVLGYV